MLLQVHGSGTLVAQDVRLLPAPAEGRVEKVLNEVGIEVKPDTVIVELSNPQMEQQAIRDSQRAQRRGSSHPVRYLGHGQLQPHPHPLAFFCMHGS